MKFVTVLSIVFAACASSAAYAGCSADREQPACLQPAKTAAKTLSCPDARASLYSPIVQRRTCVADPRLVPAFADISAMLTPHRAASAD
jgi:hypothetical protein